MKMKPKHIVGILVLLIVVSVIAYHSLQTEPITLERTVTWTHLGNKRDPSQMALVQTEFNTEISFGSKEYTGPQTPQALMNAFDDTYNRQHARTTVTVFSKESITEIKKGEITETDAWKELLLNEGISSQYTLAEIDERYPRTPWLQLLLERGITIKSPIHYFYCMAHRDQLAYLEDNPHLWEIKFHDISLGDTWETYKASYIDEIIAYYTFWKSNLGSTKEQTKTWIQEFKKGLR